MHRYLFQVKPEEYMRFTIITPTCNRAHTLNRVYESLTQQTYTDFEWLIIDDGSSDGTANLVSHFKESASFPIRYDWKPNGGRHTALNLGVQLAKGEFVMILDSDDRCIPHALECFDHHWKQIPNPDVFSTLVCLCMTPDGKIIGDLFRSDVIDGLTFAEQLHIRGNSNRSGINRTKVLREFPFPEGERCVPDSLIWNRMAKQYAARFVNEALYIYYYEPAGDTMSAKATAALAASPKSTLAYYRELFHSQAPTGLRTRAGLNWLRFRTHQMLGTGRS
jgi:glycosyltransferase involved in cell wall biosynthesis